VITANSSSLPEAGGDVSKYVDPCSIDEIKNAMLQLRIDGKGTETCIAARKAHVHKFAPESTASQLISVYQDIL